MTANPVPQKPEQPKQMKQLKDNENWDAIILGAGLVGSLLGSFLRRRGQRVLVLERRPDMRKESISAGKSINLAISVRGVSALQALGFESHILSKAVPMRGRMMHSMNQELTFQPYGIRPDECIRSISRGELNKDLMDLAGSEVTFRFQQEPVALDLDRGLLTYKDIRTGATTQATASILFGADGAFSWVRQSLKQRGEISFNESTLDYGYKELTISSEEGRDFERNALHIWPRGKFMLIALPNHDGSFTCTLFLPHKREASSLEPNVPCFEELDGGEDSRIEMFFEKTFPDATKRISNLVDTFRHNPTGQMVTVRTKPWIHTKGPMSVALIGDAAHAIVPFFGQGMNCGFEDCLELDQLIEVEHGDGPGPGPIPWRSVLTKYDQKRKPNADAIATMAVENFTEMRDRVGDSKFLLEKAIERKLESEMPECYVSRYRLVSFHRVPYRFAYDVGLKQARILELLSAQFKNPRDIRDMEQALSEISMKDARSIINRELGIDFTKMV